jgi:hypothetical protein
MRVNNTLFYYTTELIMGVKSFMALAQKATTVPINLATVLYCRVHGIHIEIPWV